MTENADIALRVVDLKKQFRRERGGEVAAVDGVSLDLERGTMLTVLGPSGCGKTTLLRCIAGLEQPTGGEVWSGGRLLSSGAKGIAVPPEKRHFGMMFQSYAVWPHMSVFQNVAYPLQVRHWSKAKIEKQVSNILDVVGIGHLRNEYSARLSGGQQQRIALARCLVSDPEVILFDEPLSNVDAKVREELRVELRAMQARIGFAGIYVTHDQDEAMAISDLVLVMNEGKAVQVGPPREVYGRPRTRFVASFVGVVNMWEGQVKAEPAPSATRIVTCDIGDVAVADNATEGASAVGDKAVVVARPESLSVSADAPAEAGGRNVWRGVLRTEMFHGSFCDLLVDVNGCLVRVRSNEDVSFAVGDSVHVSVAPHKLRALPFEEAVAAKVVVGSRPDVVAGPAPAALIPATAASAPPARATE